MNLVRHEAVEIVKVIRRIPLRCYLCHPLSERKGRCIARHSESINWPTSIVYLHVSTANKVVWDRDGANTQDTWSAQLSFYYTSDSYHCFKCCLVWNILLTVKRERLSFLRTFGMTSIMWNEKKFPKKYAALTPPPPTPPSLAIFRLLCVANLIMSHFLP